MGQANGGPALDYTVNCALGYPLMTGPESMQDEPVNHVLPAWDLLAGAYTAFSLLAADKHRSETGQGGEYKIPLSDVGITAAANLGQLAEVLYTNENRPRYGNELYGAFGKDFKTADGTRMMIMALTSGQWRGLLKVLDIESEVAAIEAERGVSLAKDEGLRFENRDVLYPLVEARVSKWQATELQSALDNVGGCWGSYQSLRDAADDKTLVSDNPVFTNMQNPSGFSYPTPGSALSIAEQDRQQAVVAPRLGQDSRLVLESVLGYSDEQINQCIEQGIVGSVEDVS